MCSDCDSSANVRDDRTERAVGSDWGNCRERCSLQGAARGSRLVARAALENDRSALRGKLRAMGEKKRVGARGNPPGWEKSACEGGADGRSGAEPDERSEEPRGTSGGAHDGARRGPRSDSDAARGRRDDGAQRPKDRQARSVATQRRRRARSEPRAQGREEAPEEVRRPGAAPASPGAGRSAGP